MISRLSRVRGVGPGTAWLPRLALCLGAILTTSARATEWILKVDVTETTTTEYADGKPPKTEERHYPETIALHQDYVAVDLGETRITYDFVHRTQTTLTTAGNTYQRGSLYPLPAFYAHELVNRTALGVGMRALKNPATAKVFDRFWDESALRMESRRAPPDSPPPKIERTDGDGVMEFRYEGDLVVRFAPAKEKIPAGFQHRFANFLAYHCDLHPQIRRAILETGAPPQELMFRARNGNLRRVTTLRLLSAQTAESDSAALPPDAKVPAPEANDLFSQLLVPVEAAASRAARPTLNESATFAADAVKAGRPLDGLLALMEYTLVTGVRPTEEMNRHRKAFDASKDCQIYRQAFKDTTKEQAEQNLKLNASLDRTKLKKAYMLELQRANLLEATGKPHEARDAFVAVIRTNPYHTGALHDLGMNFARNYEEFRAWRCWDAARQLYPNHPMMQDVAMFERDLVQQQPDFF